MTERAATSLKYQGQCIANGEQNLAVPTVRAAIEVSDLLMPAIVRAIGRVRSGLWSALAPAASAKNLHAILNLQGNLIVAHHCSRVA